MKDRDQGQMRRAFLFLTGFFILSTIFLLTGTPAQAKSWDFASFDVEIMVQSDGSFKVQETQTVNFDGDFSYFYRSIDHKGLKDIRDINVLDADGRPVDKHVYLEDGKTVIKLDIDIHGSVQKTWIFEYVVIGGLRFFDDHDELYWNAISSERDVGIKSTKVRVVLPSEAVMTKMMSKLFYGPAGSTDTLDTHMIVDSATFEFEHQDIAPNTHLTIVAGWPKGIVDEPFLKSRLFGIISAFVGLILFVLIALTVIILFNRYGRDPKGRETIIPQYEPPDKVGPLALAMLVNEKVGTKDISAAIIDMARRGYLKIHELSKKKWMREHISYSIELLKAPDGLTKPEKLVLNGLFGDGALEDRPTKIDLDDLKDKFYKNIPDIKKVVMAEAKVRGYYSRNPMMVRMMYFGAAVAMIMLAIFLAMGLPDFINIFIGVGAGGVVFLGFANFMSRRNPQGVLAYEHAMGFKDYLHTAERFRIEASTPDAFEQYLPHAMVLGVEKQWADRFADIYDREPEWYSGAGHTFSAPALAANMNIVSSSMGSTLASSPSSSSSGFGGGGSAGGGGGGGGSGAG